MNFRAGLFFVHIDNSRFTGARLSKGPDSMEHLNLDAIGNFLAAGKGFLFLVVGAAAWITVATKFLATMYADTVNRNRDAKELRKDHDELRTHHDLLYTKVEGIHVNVREHEVLLRGHRPSTT